MNIWQILGCSKVSFHHAAKPIRVHTENGDLIDLLEICKSSTPPCRLAPWLFNGHLQTLWTVINNQDPPLFYKRRVFEADDRAFSGSFAIDFVVPQYDGTDEHLPPRTTYFSDQEFQLIGGDDKKPMIVVLHGLSGGSYEAYVRYTLLPLVQHREWEACVVNSRGCAKSEISSGILYNARATWDVRQTVKWLKGKFPNRPLFGLGFSLGACILVNYLGEEGDNCALNAAVVIANPWNLDVGSHALQRSWVGLNVYSRAMATSMKALFESHAEQISNYSRIDMQKVRQVRYLHEFDRELQGPTWGYPTEGAYYRDASSCDSLLAVKIPLFAVNAEDDPIAVKEGLPIEEFKQNPYTVLCTTTRGGHLGCFESGGGRWFVKPAAKFLERMASENKLVLELAEGKQERPVKVRSDHRTPSFKPMRRKLRLDFQ